MSDNPWNCVKTSRKEMQLRQYDTMEDLAKLQYELTRVILHHTNVDTNALKLAIDNVSSRYMEMQSNIKMMIESAERGTFQDASSGVASRVDKYAMKKDDNQKPSKKRKEPASISVILKGKGLEDISHGSDNEAVNHLVAITEQRCTIVGKGPPMEKKHKHTDNANTGRCRTRSHNGFIELKEHLDIMAPDIPEHHADLYRLLAKGRFGVHNKSITKVGDDAEVTKAVTDFARHGRAKRAYWIDVTRNWRNKSMPSILEFVTWFINHNYPDWVWGQKRSITENPSCLEYYKIAPNLISHVQGLSAHVLNATITAEVVELLSVLMGPTRGSYKKKESKVLED
jgi:hypothetical protein